MALQRQVTAPDLPTPYLRLEVGASVVGGPMPRLIPLTHEVFSRHIQPRHLFLPVLVGPDQEHGVIWGADGGLVCPRIRQGEPAEWLRWYTVSGLQLDTSRPEVAEALNPTP